MTMSRGLENETARVKYTLNCVILSINLIECIISNIINMEYGTPTHFLDLW